MKGPFRALDDAFIKELKTGKLKYVLQFERKNRKSFMVEIRNNFVDLYFLGHTIEVKRRKTGYYLTASEQFNPRGLLFGETKELITKYSDGKWQIEAKRLKSYKQFEDIITAVIARIVAHKRGNISEGVSEVNHFIDNRAIGKNGILVIDRQVIYPGRRDCIIDLLGLRRIGKRKNKFTFSALELKNKNNPEIEQVFSQVKRYMDIIFHRERYEDFRVTYQEILKQKVKLGLLRAINCEIVPWDELNRNDIEGIVILDNYNIKGDLREAGLLLRAIRDWRNVSDKYKVKMFLKTNVLDSTFFMSLEETDHMLKKYKSCN
jgi:hypothetical protein